MIRMKIEGIAGSVLEELISMLSSMQSPQGLPATAKAVEQAALIVQGAWHDYALGKKALDGVPPMKHPNGGYAKGITIERPTPFSRNIVNESKAAEFIEHGTPELDMKKTHTKGPRSRVSKKGVPYLIVPFRWGTPKTVGFRNVMPAYIYNMVKKLKKTKTTMSADDSSEEDKTSNARGEMVGRAKYKWGGRFDYVLGDTNFKGMVRSTDSTGKDRSGGYFTFRVISANSPPRSWIKPATPARHVVEGLMKSTKETVETILEAGLRKDIPL